MDLELKIPENIVVHLGAPDDASAQNVTVPFVEYIKNVASSEIYPTWPENALIANILAQITFALNRVTIEHYRSQGYNFDITNLEAYDQAFIPGRDYFENISRIVDDIFNSYLVREGNFNPIFPRYCSGTTSVCPGGMSQWGTVELAESGYSPIEILRNYYGDDIVIVENAPVADIPESYPGTPLRFGDIGFEVKRMQIQLNRISRNYPSIPKIAYPDGYFDAITEDAVKEFQRVFNLTPDGIIGRATWYQINRIYNAVKKLAELDAEGIPLEFVNRQYQELLQRGDEDPGVQVIQYYLRFIGTFNDFIPPVEIDGIFGPATENAVRAFQQAYGLPVDGKVDEATWNKLYSVYYSILSGLPPDYSGTGILPFQGTILYRGASGDTVRTLQQYLAEIANVYQEIPQVSVTGYFGPETEQAVIAYQNLFGLPPRGTVGPITWDSIASLYSDIVNGNLKNSGQYPGYVMSESSSQGG
ncbi:MAG TPA: peptidoglycan-binding protein [Candidatus Monoglobus merdigallinarum]|uniref:Peptidoglycan-binding protein n=1 Tax=Candidatus Monoglobus merdigallinarum TaxID=2838698 RepID=A0A9D1PQD6_9FIRM|nr:peptidoglycan-binding protein [Candidatus Monoglobus merdigallinarum]